MNDKRSMMKKTRLALAVSLLAAGSFATAANFDSINLNQNDFGNLEPAPLNQPLGAPSILESMQQEKLDEKKRDYLEVLDLIKQNKLDDAGKEIKSLLKQFPNDPEFFNLKALLETVNKETASAEQSYQKAISLDKNNILAHLGLAKMALDAGDLAKAKDYADKTLAINNKTVNAYLILADVALKQKNNGEVESVLTTALKQVEGNITAEIQVISNLGKFYAVQKQPEKILALGENLAKRYPDDSRALSVLAGAQIVNNQKPEAEQTLTQLVSKNKNDVDHRLLLARLLIDDPDKGKEVMKLLDEALAIAPDKPDAYVFKAAYLIKEKRYDEALGLADGTEKKFPALSLGNLLKGDVYLAERKLDNALDNYQKAYKKQANNKVLFTIADILYAQKKAPEAIQLLDKELAKNSKNIALHFKLATIYQQQNDYKLAEKHYNALLAAQPDNALALNNLAWIYSQQNDPKALETAKKAYTLAPQAPAIADTYGDILVKQGQPQEGLTILEKAAAAAPKANDIQFHLAEAYAATNQQSKAIEILERIVNGEQNFSEKKAAVDLLDTLKKK